ncbi:MAG TPA: TIGR00730 family Rossman fold protein [Planctomycetota bacterium]|nr:TIGR00730 family Rossman fold protein [Planctomycetota bacterium]
MPEDPQSLPVSKPGRRAQKAYLNPQFLRSRDARIVRMMCEYLEPFQRFMRLNVRETIVFFGSARAKPPITLKAEMEALEEEKKKGRLSKESREKLEKLEANMRLSIFYEEAAELSGMLTRWAKSLGQGKRFVICSGGGPGIMEAANRGAVERGGGATVGLAISLPTEEAPNPYITPELLFEFHYFFMRKLWFAYLACALVIFPGGFGTMDELFEILTLVQTRKIGRPMPIVLYGKDFWDDFMDFDALIRWGTISPQDVDLFKVCNTPKEAFEHLKKELLKHYPKPQMWTSHAP